jgi:hypothetical protein
MPETALFADAATRRVRGLLLPFGEVSRRNLTDTDPIMFGPGTVTLPPDLTVFMLNRMHSQVHPVGRGVELTETAEGIVAEFQIAAGPDGDATLDDISSGRVKALSAEVRDMVRDGVKAVRATLTGAALAPPGMGAFAGAGLFTLAPDEAATLVAAIAENVAAVTETPADTDPATTPAADNQEGQFAMPNATVPAGVTAPVENTPARSASALFAATAYAGQSKDSSLLEQFADLGDLFTIATVQHSGPSAVTIGADVQVPQALQELWDRRPFQRKFAPLFNQQALTSMKVYGWRWATSPVVASYAGNTAEIPSAAVDTTPVTADAVRLAGGHRLDRRYSDFGDQGIIESYYRHMTESYARVSDAAILAAAVAGATPVTGGDYRSGMAAGLAGVVDGALAVIASENTPTFAVVSPELWRDVVLTGATEVLGYLTASLGLESGDLEGFRIIPGAVGTGTVLVGAKESMTVFELPGVPIRVDALAVHNASTDAALFGYYATLVNNAAALAHVTPGDEVPVTVYTETAPA